MGRPITREMRSVDLHLSKGGVHGELRFIGLRFNLSRSSRGVITVEIKSTENALRASDRNPTASVLRHFITHAMSLHLSRRSAIQRPILNGNDSHPMRFIRAVDRGFNGNWTVTPNLPYKLRWSSRL